MTYVLDYFDDHSKIDCSNDKATNSDHARFWNNATIGTYKDGTSLVSLLSVRGSHLISEDNIVSNDEEVVVRIQNDIVNRMRAKRDDVKNKKNIYDN